jgi:hypothetical protein
VNECVIVFTMDDSFDTMAMGTISREESLFDQDDEDDDEKDSVDEPKILSQDEEEHRRTMNTNTTPTIVSQTMESVWMNRIVSWWGGSSQSSPGNLTNLDMALLHCGDDNDTTPSALCGDADVDASFTLTVEDTALDEVLAWNQAVAKLLRRTEFIASSMTTTSSLFTPIPHVRQLETWDCGVACLQMIWQWLNISTGSSSSSIHDTDTDTDITTSNDDTQKDRDWMLQRLQTESVWTVDLVLLLDHLICSSSSSSSSSAKSQQASYLLSSKTLGVNETLGDIGYYRAAFFQDQQRVRELFGDIEQRQLPVLQQPRLSLEQIVAVIKEPHCIAVCLVDNAVLLAHDNNNNNNKRVMVGTAATSQTPGTQQEQQRHVVDDTYAGHYILLQGISCKHEHLQQARGTSIDMDAAADADDSHSDYSYCFVVQNPNPGCSGTTYLSPDRFERAWRAEGTDEDIIFVAKHVHQHRLAVAA